MRGVANLPSLAAASGAELDNEGTVTFLGSINTNGTATVINRATGTIVVLTPGFALGPAAVVTNLGTIEIRGAVNLNGSTVTNQGLITAVGPLTMSGSLTNAGRLAVDSTVTVNSNSTLANTCRLESSGLINNGTTSNAGVIAARFRCAVDQRRRGAVADLDRDRRRWGLHQQRQRLGRRVSTCSAGRR